MESQQHQLHACGAANNLSPNTSSPSGHNRRPLPSHTRTHTHNAPLPQCPPACFTTKNKTTTKSKHTAFPRQAGWSRWLRRLHSHQRGDRSCAVCAALHQQVVVMVMATSLCAGLSDVPLRVCACASFSPLLSPPSPCPPPSPPCGVRLHACLPAQGGRLPARSVGGGHECSTVNGAAGADGLQPTNRGRGKGAGAAGGGQETGGVHVCLMMECSVD